jgi:hypothetical protein
MQALALKQYFWGAESSKICDKRDTFSSLGDSPVLGIVKSPSDGKGAAAVTHSADASGFRPSFFRDRNSGSFFADDFDDFFKDCLEVCPFGLSA